MNNQEAFTKAAKGLLGQMARSVDSEGGCKYRGNGGLCCGIGFLVDDKLASIMDTGVSQLYGHTNTVVADVVKIEAVGEVLGHLDITLLECIQDVHDSHLPDSWEEQLKMTAEQFNLKWEL